MVFNGICSLPIFFFFCYFRQRGNDFFAPERGRDPSGKMAVARANVGWKEEGRAATKKKKRERDSLACIYMFIEEGGGNRPAGDLSISGVRPDAAKRVSSNAMLLYVYAAGFGSIPCVVHLRVRLNY